MATGSLTNPIPDAMKWKQAFEKALNELAGDEKAAQRATPIYQRRTADSGDPGKRALSEAADALAALWRNDRKRR